MAQLTTSFITFVYLFVTFTSAEWTSDDFALFDLVEEVKTNFYDVLQVPQTAETSEIKRAYRKLSLIWHPDKNDAANASTVFRQLADIHNVLKSEASRKKYNDVLEFGLPDWRQPIYYYRYARKVSIWELIIILFLIVSTAQYLMLWGSYFERKLAVSEHFESRLRKQEKKLKRKHNIDVDELINEEVAKNLKPRPKITDLLPFTLGCLIYYAVIALPSTLRTLTTQLIEKYKMRNKVESQSSEGENTTETVVTRPRVKIEHIEYEMAADTKPVSTMVQDDTKDDSEIEYITGSWTIEELNYLIRLSVNKYPTGTPNRWQKLGEALGRRADDVTTMIARLKHTDVKDYARLCGAQQQSAEPTPQASMEGATVNMEQRGWSVDEQKLLEQALMRIGKDEPDRWSQIAKCVPGRTKDECITRFKYIAQLVKQKKQSNT